MDDIQLDELIRRCETLHIPMQALAQGFERSGLACEAFCDAFAHRVALRYIRGSLDFDAANAAMNNLAAHAFRPPELGPGPYMWRIYHAFDAGEERHPDDAPDMNRAERYTRP